jgi:SAM-dependent methyltransferase
LEHVDSPRQAVSEAARVLRPDGLYLYDTVNRTVRSKLLMIKLFQDWKATAFMEPNLHDIRCSSARAKWTSTFAPQVWSQSRSSGRGESMDAREASVGRWGVAAGGGDELGVARRS